jgi:DNA-directed RNA polymerase specialized sigma24 family protein
VVPLEDVMSASQTSLGDWIDPLTEAEREVYDAVELGPYGPREYARETDRAFGTVGNLLRRARAKVGRSHGP